MPAKKEPESIIIYSFPHFVYVWPIIFFGLVLAALQSGGVIGESGAAWTYIVISSIVLLTMGVDLGRNTSIFCLVLFAALWMTGMWLQGAKGVTLFSTIGGAIAGLHPLINGQAMVILSVILGIIYVIMFGLAFVNDKWRITNNEIEHRVFGHKDDATGRGAKRVLATYPDFLELLICLSGTIEVYSASGTQKLCVIKNVPFLPLRMKKISHILETTSVNDASISDDEHDDGAHEETTTN